MKIAIIGDGAIGWSIYAELKLIDPHLKIKIFGNNEPSASRAAGAMLNVFSEIDENTFVHSVCREKFNLSVQATKLWPEWAVRHDLPVEFGRTKIVAFNEYDARNIVRIVEGLKCQDQPHLFDPIDHSVTIDEGWINPVSLLSALSRDTPTLPFSDYKSENFDQVIYCAGAYTPNLLKFHVKTYYNHGAGGVFTTEHGLTEVVRTPNRFGSCGINLVPRGTSELYIGASSYVSNSAHYTDTEIYRSFRHIFTQANALVALPITEEYRIVFGPRPMTEDLLPLLGAYDEKTIVYCGTNRNGLTLSPLIAQDAVSRILGGKPMIGDTFSPLRKPTYWIDKAAAIRQTIEGLQNNAVLHNEPEFDFYAAVHKFYETYNIELGIPPELYSVYHRQQQAKH